MPECPPCVSTHGGGGGVGGGVDVGEVERMAVRPVLTFKHHPSS